MLQKEKLNLKCKFFKLFLEKVYHASNLFENLCIYISIKPDYGKRITVRMST